MEQAAREAGAMRTGLRSRLRGGRGDKAGKGLRMEGDPAAPVQSEPPLPPGGGSGNVSLQNKRPHGKNN